MVEPILVTVIGGYLGAGKTTLLNHLLRTTDERLAVLVNDFGSINIDEDLVVASDDDKITLANGCICCSLVDGFAGALQSLLELDDPPPRLVIEASGVADPSVVAAYAHVPGLELDGVIVVVDAETARTKADDAYVGDTVVQQLRSADLLVVNKVDVVKRSGPTGLVATREWLDRITTATPAVEAVQAEVPPQILLGLPRSWPRDVDPPPPAGRAADEVFEAWTFEAVEPLERDALASMLDSLPPDIIRVKGVVRCTDAPDERLIVQRVGNRQILTVSGAWENGVSRLVAIGRRGTIDDEWLAARLG